MKIIAIAMARAICFVSLEDLNPRGRIFYPDLSKGLVEEFRFQKAPTGLWELDLQSGISFEDGKVGDIVVQKLSIYRTGFVIDTISSTSDSEKALEDILGWGVKNFGVNYHPSMITRTGYYSQIVAHLDLPLDRLNPVLASTSKIVSEMVARNFNMSIPYETSAVHLSFDPSRTTLTPGGFSIEKRAGHPFSENRYFCGAPLRTEEHIDVLQRFEDEAAGREPSKLEIESVLSDASKSVSFWMEHADANEMRDLQRAVDTIRNVKEFALKRQQSKIS